MSSVDIVTPPSQPARVMLVTSPGGHLAQLLSLRPWWSARERVWVTHQLADAVSLLAGERVHWAYYPTTRNLINLVRNFCLAFSLVRRYHPQLVVSCGAGVAPPFFLVARLFGIRTVYIEVYDRVDLCTVSGRLCQPLSSCFLLQWDEQRVHYRRGEVIGRLL